MFEKDLFLTAISKMQGLEMLQYFGTKTYLVSFLILFFVPAITAIIMANTMKGKKLASILLVVFGEMLLIIIGIISGILPWLTSMG